MSKVFHRNAEVLAWLNGEDASKIDWQDTHLVWTATNSQWHQTIQYWHNLNEIWELWQKGWCSANNDWNISCKKESHTILKRHEGEFSVISEELFLECQIVSHCGRSASWVQQPADSPCLSIFPNWDLKYVKNGLVTSNNRPNPRLLKSLHKYYMLRSKTNPRSSL